MASIRQIAQEHLDIAREGIGFIALWRHGRSWEAATFWPDYNERTNEVRFDADDRERLQEITNEDPAAVILCSYIDNLGGLEDLTRDDLAAALRWQYDRNRATITGYLENERQEGRA